MFRHFQLLILLLSVSGCYYVATRLIQQPITEADYVNGRMLYVHRGDTELHIHVQENSDSIWFLISCGSENQPFTVPLSGFYILAGDERYYPTTVPGKLGVPEQPIVGDTTLRQGESFMVEFPVEIANYESGIFHLPKITDASGRVIEDFSEIVFIREIRRELISINK